MSTPELQLATLFVLDARGRIVATREPAGRAPAFILIRSATRCVWALRADVGDEAAAAVSPLAAAEAPTADPMAEPTHARAYAALLGGTVEAGPAFWFPAALAAPADVAAVDDERLLARHFRGWVPGEIAAGRSPVLAILDGGAPVSVCFCARRSAAAAEAGVETAGGFRGRGLAPRVTAAWAAAVRASGRTPLYSTSWQNRASLAVARKLGLRRFASDWSVSGRAR